MRRRDFITLLGGAAAAWPFAARAQQAGRLPTIGVLGASQSAWSRWIGALEERLRQLGWIDGRTVAIVYRWTEERGERTTPFAEELVRLKVDVIFTSGTPNIVAAKQATASIPIVFTGADPVGTGLVTSLARPGANTTGLSQMSPDLAGKRLQLLHQVLPELRQVAVLGNVDNPGVVAEMGEAQSAGRILGLEVTPAPIRRADDIFAAFAAIKGRVQAVYVAGDPLVGTNRVRIITLALGARLPTVFNVRDHVEAGGLMSYGPNFDDLFRRAGDYIDRILRGAKPSDLPVEQPTKFDLVVNLTTAKALDLTVPPTLLALADEVIE
jgi:putative ABC transport system substrate-binding protein